MLPPELVAGVRFDLNRPFGNGYDDNGNGVVDEPTYSEFTTANEVPTYWNSTLGATFFDLNNDGTLVNRTVIPPTRPPTATFTPANNTPNTCTS